jgi:hypothetical protein
MANSDNKQPSRLRQCISYIARRATCDGAAIATFLIPPFIWGPYIMRTPERVTMVNLGAMVMLIYTWAIGGEFCLRLREHLFDDLDDDRRWHHP